MFDTEVLYRRAWQQAATELGQTMSNELYGHLVGRGSAECHALLLDLYGPHFPVSAFLTRSGVLFQDHVGHHGIPHKPGLGAVLDLLDTRGIPKAIATSTKQPLAAQCLGPLARRFEVIVTGDEVRQVKPAPDLFLLAAQRLHQAPAHCLVLEDSEAGVQAALHAAMPVILVPDLMLPSAHLVGAVTRVCATLYDVKDLLQAV